MFFPDSDWESPSYFELQWYWSAVFSWEFNMASLKTKLQADILLISFTHFAAMTECTDHTERYLWPLTQKRTTRLSVRTGETHGYRTGEKRVTKPFETDETERVNGSWIISNGWDWTTERLMNNFERIAMNGWTAHVKFKRKTVNRWTGKKTYANG